MERALLEADHESERARRQALYVVAAATFVRLLLALLIPLFPDETYYWDWSRHLAGGYFDHPPMIALLIGVGRVAELDGRWPLSVRLFPVLVGGVASLATVGIAWRVGGGRAARTTAIIFALMPLAATGLVLATPDAPLLAASALGLYSVVRALQSPLRSDASLAWWTAAGIALGLAFASKYTSILLPVTITVAVLSRSSLRARLREPGPYVACIMATVVFLPVLRWNAQHDWISFRFQLQHGLGVPSKGSALKRELDLIGGQLGLVSPILFALGANAVWRTLRRPVDDVRFALAVVAGGSWAFFVYSALRRSVEANWPAPSYIPGVVLLAVIASSPGRDRWVRRGIVLAGVLVAIIYVHAVVPILPIRARRDPLARAFGWEKVAHQVDSARLDLGQRNAGSEGDDYRLRDVPDGESWIGADRYQDVSELAFHSGLIGLISPDERHDVAFCTCLGGRRNQYHLWPGFPQSAKPGDALVLLLDETPPAETHGTVRLLAPYFHKTRRGALAPLMRGADTVSLRRIWVLEGYRGGWPPRDDR